MFYPEYVDMETDIVGMLMEGEMRKFLDEELSCHIMAAISNLCKRFSRVNFHLITHLVLKTPCYMISACQVKA